MKLADALQKIRKTYLTGIEIQDPSLISNYLSDLCNDTTENRRDMTTFSMLNKEFNFFKVLYDPMVRDRSIKILNLKLQNYYIDEEFKSTIIPMVIEILEGHLYSPPLAIPPLQQTKPKSASRSRSKSVQTITSGTSTTPKRRSRSSPGPNPAVCPLPATSPGSAPKNQANTTPTNSKKTNRQKLLISTWIYSLLIFSFSLLNFVSGFPLGVSMFVFISSIFTLPIVLYLWAKKNTSFAVKINWFLIFLSLGMVVYLWSQISSNDWQWISGVYLFLLIIFIGFVILGNRYSFLFIVGLNLSLMFVIYFYILPLWPILGWILNVTDFILIFFLFDIDIRPMRGFKTLLTILSILHLIFLIRYFFF